MFEREFPGKGPMVFFPEKRKHSSGVNLRRAQTSVILFQSLTQGLIKTQSLQLFSSNMSYSRTYRNSNGVGAYRTNLNEGQNERQGATGSQAEQPQQEETASPSLERRVLTKKKGLKPPCITMNRSQHHLWNQQNIVPEVLGQLSTPRIDRIEFTLYFQKYYLTCLNWSNH